MTIDFQKLLPLGENFLVKRLPAKTVSAGGIHIPDQAQEAPMEAVLVRVGKGKHDSEADWCFPDEIDEGDKLLLSRFGGTELDDDHLVVPASSILGVFSSSHDSGRLFTVGKQVLVRMDPREERKGSIVVPEFGRGTNVWGRVVRAGAQCRQDDGVPHIHGRRVYVTPQQGTHYREAGIDYIILHENKITMEEADNVVPAECLED